MAGALRCGLGDHVILLPSSEGTTSTSPQGAPAATPGPDHHPQAEWPTGDERVSGGTGTDALEHDAMRAGGSANAMKDAMEKLAKI